jgi:polyribonucleotide nucleotidyltransferase
MNLNKKQFTTEVADKKLTLEVSNLAEQANAAVLGTYGDTSVLVTVTMAGEDQSADHVPLTIDYEERFYAAGKILGSRFVRRERQPSEEAVLSGRLIDRSLRPLFDSHFRREIQIVITVLSYDEENDPDFIALLSASTALAISDIPWNGPIAGVRVAGLSNDEIFINPANSQIKGKTDLIFEGFVAGPKEKINMIELAASEVSEDEIIQVLNSAQQEIKNLIDFQREIIKKVGRPKIEYQYKINEELAREIKEFLKDKLGQAVYTAEKVERQNKITLLREDLNSYLIQKGFVNSNQLPEVNNLFEEKIDELVHKNIIELEKRPDGRRLDEFRNLYIEVGLFKRLHGSALFARGNTQALAVVTLAPPGAEQLIETMEITARRRFLLHYNFPPFCTGEIGKLGTGRREIGHGALAEKAIKPLIPSSEEFPYTIRVVSEILSSNGSSSMATVCASSLALMDAGVPIKKAASGIAMGLMTDGKDNYKILTDIQGPEDHHGDMDCKVAGTKDGFTAIQMDVKVKGITPKIFKEVLVQAKKAHLGILEAMNKVIDKPRSQISSYAPLIMALEISPEQIGEVIGPGGKMINKIIKDTGVETIDVEESGRVFVAAADHEKALSAIRYITSMTRTHQVGEIVEGKVIKILDFGAIVDLGAGKDGMIHVSELKDGFVEKVEDVVNIGDMVKVKIIKVENSKIGLSLKAAKNGN